jgi:hypothetical protein
MPQVRGLMSKIGEIVPHYLNGPLLLATIWKFGFLFANQNKLLKMQRKVGHLRIYNNGKN